MLFSSLVDADNLDTEAHFEGDASGKRYRQSVSQLDASNALKSVLSNRKFGVGSCLVPLRMTEGGRL